jgi:glycosyltransferase involved in cell wall biosynthesis
MNVGISSPYVKTLGGGEQYIFTIASCLLPEHKVTLFTDEPGLIVAAEQRFGFPLSGLTARPDVINHGSIIQRSLATLGLDVFIHVSDGSFPFSLAKKTFYIVQFPIPWVTKNSFIDRIKMHQISKIICYSEFVKSYLTPKFTVPIEVLPPCIRIRDYSVGEKKPYILSVGRFTQGMNTKNQHIMIEAMKALLGKGIRGWKLILAGGMLPEDRSFVEKLITEVKGYPIEIQVNISRESLLSLYTGASIYWHAAGYGVDILKHPEQVEHFGITTVEAMASGAIPIVFPAGGQKEIVDDGLNGYYWKDIEELAAKTNILIKDSKESGRLMHTARIKADIYDIGHFRDRVRTLLQYVV